MTLLGFTLLVLGIGLKGIMYPAEYSLAGEYSDRARIFRNSFNVIIYTCAEWALRIGGTFILVESFFDFSFSVIGAFIFGILAFMVAPGLSMLVATTIYPWFKKTLAENNPR
jgi:hypothetical protein